MIRKFEKRGLLDYNVAGESCGGRMKKWWKARDWRALGRFSVQSVGTMAASFAMVVVRQNSSPP